MRLIALLAVVAPLALGAAGCRRNKCLPNCEQRAKEVNCSAYLCKDECEDLHKRKECRKELDAFEACFLKQPKENWFCAGDKPAPKLEVCVKERTAVSDCLS